MIDRAHADDSIPLDHLAAGQTARVARLIGCPEHVRRLEEMGVRPGIRVQMLQRGKPCIVRAGVNRLCFRCSDLLGILVSDCHVTR